MQNYQTDPNTALNMGVTCPCILVAFMMLAIFFVFPEKRHELFPYLKEYRVKIDFNELQRLRDEEAEKRALISQTPQTGQSTSSSPTSEQATVDTTDENNIASSNTSADDSSSNEPGQNTNDRQETSPDTDQTENDRAKSDSEETNSATNNQPNANKRDSKLSPLDKLVYRPTVPVAAILTPPLYTPPELPPRKGKALKFVKTTLKGVPFYQATIDLKDPEMFLSIELANKADQANTVAFTHGDEGFESFVKRSRGAVVQNGTFFSKDNQKRVMGNMVNSGRYLKYSQWENYGTTLGIKKNNVPEMITARIEGQPDWSQHWFSLTCGPRLVTNGEILIDAEKEGFADSHVLGVGPRCAIGYPASKDKIYLVTFLMGLSLQKEAEVMKAMGCSDAMNLDGGASKAVAHNGAVVVPAHRPLTNVIVVYDTKFPAPKPLISSWKEFQKRPDQQLGVSY
ncbi:MAG: phosphodiester glycosidase family protein [Candidatus Melainabacteria bacterium]|nr:phosphodiester glycosidase family protein [Candidatus Melainabacteria bacterium]